MDSEFRITRDIADIIAKVCFDIAESSRLFDEENPQNSKWYIACDMEVKKGLKWFIGSANYRIMCDNVAAFRESVEMVLHIYKNQTLPFNNKNNIIKVLNNLHGHLTELQQQIIKTYKV